MIMKLSCDWPNALPMGEATPSPDTHASPPEWISDRIHVGKELRRYIGTDENNLGAMVVVRLGDEAAFRHGDTAHVRVVRGNSHHVRADKPLVSAPYFHRMVVEGRDGARVFMLSRRRS